MTAVPGAPVALSLALLAGIVAVLFLWRRWLVEERGGFRYWVWVAACFYVGARPALLVFQLDSPFPDGAIPGVDWPAALVDSLIAVLLWVAALGVALWFAGRGAGRAWRPSPSPQDDRSLVLTALLASVGASALLLLLIDRLGGFDVAITALKRDQLGSNSQLFALAKNAGLVAAMAGAATVVSSLRAGKPLAVAAVRSLLFLTPAGLTFAVGARDAAVFGAVAMATATFHRLDGLNLRSVLRMAAAAGAVILLGVGLRIARDVASTSEVSGNIADRSAARQISIAANMTSFDALAHASYVTPTEFDFAGASDFLASFQGLPGVPGEPSPDDERPAVRIIRHHLPTRINGNPLTAIGDWYVAGGLSALLVGAVLSGGLLGYLARKFRSAPHDALIHVVGTVTALRILPLGISATTPSVGVQFALSTGALVVLLQVIRRWLDPASTAMCASKPRAAGPALAAVQRSKLPALVIAGVMGGVLGGLVVATGNPQTVEVSTFDFRNDGTDEDVAPGVMAQALELVGSDELAGLFDEAGIDATVHVSVDRSLLVVAVSAVDADERNRATALVVDAVATSQPRAAIVEAGVGAPSRGTPAGFVVLAGALLGGATMGASQSLRGQWSARQTQSVG